MRRWTNQLWQFMWDLRMKISCHFCVQDWLKYQYPGGVYIYSEILYHDDKNGAKVKDPLSMPCFYILSLI